MSTYHVRPGTLDDVDALVHHRIGMFTDMGLSIDTPAIETAFRRWLADAMPAGIYRAWVVEDRAPDGSIVAGGGITILPWPPGPGSLGTRIAFAYNVYTEPSHRRRGLARMIMDAIHAWCRENGIGAIAINASKDGQPLYESIGYAVTPSPMMIMSLG